MEDISAIRLGGAPLPELAVPVSILAEQPEQSETDKDTQKRFVDAKPLSNEGIPSPAIAKIDAQCQSTSNCSTGRPRRQAAT